MYWFGAYFADIWGKQGRLKCLPQGPRPLGLLRQGRVPLTIRIPQPGARQLDCPPPSTALLSRMIFRRQKKGGET